MMEIPGQSRRVPPGPPPNAPYSGSGVQGEPPMSPVMAPPPPPLLPQTAPNKQLPPVPPLLGAGSPPPPHPPPHGNNSLSDNKVSISPTFYEQIFHTKGFCATSLYLKFGFVIFFFESILAQKLLVKLLLKLTKGEQDRGDGVV